MISPKITNLGYNNLWTDMSTILGYASTFDQQIQKLFANGEQGFWYDPNDLSTMYQDAAGTVPVTAVGQPVGLMLDKSKGRTLGEELFANPTMGGQWVSMGGGVYECVDSIGNSDLIINTGIVGKFYAVEFEVIENSVAVAAYSFVGAPTTITTTGVFKYIRLATTSQFMLRVGAGRSAKIRLITAKELKGNHAYQTTSASRPILRQNAVTGAYYLEFDGADDFLQTNNIDFTSTDKVSLFAVVRKLSDVNIGAVFGLSSAPISASGVFEMYTPQVVEGEGAAYYSRGASTRSAVLTQGLKAPVGFMLSAQTDIANNTVICKINQSSAGVVTGNLGGGSFSNNRLFIGRRGGTSLPFNGHIYGLIGVGKLVSDNETLVIEKEFAKRLGVTLNV